MDTRKFNDQETARRNKLSQLQKDQKDPFKIEQFKTNFNSASFIKKYEPFTKEELHESKDEIIIAGRIMAIRQTFGVIKDFLVLDNSISIKKQLIQQSLLNLNN